MTAKLYAFHTIESKALPKPQEPTEIGHDDISTNQYWGSWYDTIWYIGIDM